MKISQYPLVSFWRRRFSIRRKIFLYGHCTRCPRRDLKQDEIDMTNHHKDCGGEVIVYYSLGV